MIPLWLKILYTLFVAVLVPVWWQEHGPANFLWACDIAVLVTLVALWRESRLLAGMMAVAVLLPELLWNLDFFLRLFTGRDVIGLDATGYMFNPRYPLLVRWLSLFHVFLPPLLLWMVWRLGYPVRAGLGATLLCWLVLPLSYLFTDPTRNINLVYGWGSAPQTWLPGPLYLALLLLALPLGVYLPTHLLLKRLFGKN
jgi:hypothetical protein